jgi:hypothetical protein
MKDIVKKVLEAGLVSKHTALLMEKWGTLDRGASDLVDSENIHEMSEKTLLRFVEDIEALIERERDSVRETALSIRMANPFQVSLSRSSGIRVPYVVFKDEMGRFIFPSYAHEEISEGDIFTRVTTGEKWKVTEVVPLYVGEDLCAVRVVAAWRNR